MTSKEFNFEQSLKELEAIADSLESDKITVDESIKLFEKGINLSRECSKYLENAKQKITLLTEKERDELQDD